MRDRSFLAAALLASLLVGSATTAAAKKDSATLLDEGLRALYQEDYDLAIRRLREATRADADNAQAWGNLGLALHLAGRFDEAVDVYKQTLRFEAIAPTVKYNLACTYSRAGDKDQAFHWLDEVIKDGFRNLERLKADPDLEAIRDDPRFEEVLVKAGAHPRPCRKDERYRALDFWVGRWNVKSAETGKLVGQNFIASMLEGCLVFENWVARGREGEGKSINYFDPKLGKWRQNWVADRGYVIDYVGELRDGAMHFEGRNTGKDGTTELSRMTLTPGEDGTVRQLIEQSKDGGETWYVWFDGIYEPMEETPPAPAPAPAEDEPSP